MDPLLWRISRAEAENYLNQLAERLTNAGLKEPQVVILEGQPAPNIIEYARANNVDLILLSSHGKSGVSRWNVSSVVRKIIESARLSVMLIRAFNFQALNSPELLAELRYQRILVPLDGSLRAEVALPAAAALAQMHDGELLLAHIIQKPETIQRIPLNATDQNLLQQVIDHNSDNANRYMDEFHARLPVSFQTELRINDNVTNTIIEIARERDIDLIVLSAHGHSADSGRSYGNVTSGLIEYGPTPLLVMQDFSPGEVAPTLAEEAAREHKGHA